MRRSGTGLGVGTDPALAPWKLPEAQFRRWLVGALAPLREENLALWRAYFGVRDAYLETAMRVVRAQQEWDKPQHAAVRRELERAQNYRDRLAKSVANLEKYVAMGCPMKPNKKKDKEAKKEKDSEQSVEKMRQACAEKAVALEKAEEHLKALLEAAPEVYVELQQAKQALERFCVEHGISEAEQAVKRINAEAAKHSHSNGALMENAAAESWRTVLALPPGFYPADERLVALRNVTLGTRAMEFDVVVVRDNGEGLPVTVVAIVEVKYNPNDVGASFQHHQRSIAWLCGQRDAYNPAKFTTATYPSGHFDRPVSQVFGGRRFLFAPSSFEHFVRDDETQYYLENLYFAVRTEPDFVCAGCPSGVQACLCATLTTPPSVSTLLRNGPVPVQDYNHDEPSATPPEVIARIADFLKRISTPEDAAPAPKTTDVFQLYIHAGLANHIIQYTP